MDIKHTKHTFRPIYRWRYRCVGQRNVRTFDSRNPRFVVACFHASMTSSGPFHVRNADIARLCSYLPPCPRPCTIQPVNAAYFAQHETAITSLKSRTQLYPSSFDVSFYPGPVVA